MQEITVFQAITLAIAVVGAVLGLINTWRAVNNDRVKLLVTPVSILVPQTGEQHLAISVVNRSTFSVTVTHIGFDLAGTANHMQIFPDQRFGQMVPCKLEARTSATFHLGAGAHHTNNFDLVTNAYVNTACGRKFKGSSPALSSYVLDSTLARK